MINFKIIKLFTATIVIILVLLFSYLLMNKGTVVITSDPIASVYINNINYSTPLTIKLSPGKHSIWILKEQYEPYEKQIIVKSLKKTIVRAMLIKNENEPAEGAPTGTLDESQISSLPYSNDRFSVSWNSSRRVYTITPNIIITNSESLAPQEQMAKQWGLYTQYGQEALVWMKSQGVTPTDKNIEWWGSEWWPIGKSMSL